MSDKRKQKYTYHSSAGRGHSNGKRKRRPEPKRQGIPVAIVTVIVFLVVISYIINAAISLSNKVEIPSVAVQLGSIDVPTVLSGIIIRDEKVYTAPRAGVVNFNYNDLEKVKKGATVCSIYDEQAIDDLTDDLDEINKAIMRMQERRSDISAFKSDVDNVNLQIKNLVDNKSLNTPQSDFYAVFELKDAITQNLSLRNQILLNESRGSLSALANDKRLFESELSKNFINILADESGIISYVVDGLEQSLNFERLSELTPEETRMTVDYNRIVRDRNVEQGDEVFKVLRSNAWYIAAYLPLENVISWSEGDIRTIYIQQGSDFFDVRMQIDKLTPGDKDCYVLFRSTKNMLDYINMRSVKFKISNTEHKGFKIPSTAIVEQTLLKIPQEYVISGESLSVIKHTELADETLTLDVRNRDEDYVYIPQDLNKLALNDKLKLPIEPYTLYDITEVANIKGVFMVNRGYAEFKKITLADGVPVTSEYVILDPEANKELRIHDRIISDARTISESQKIVE